MPAQLETDRGDQPAVGAAVLAPKDSLHVPDQSGSFELVPITAGILGVVECLDFACAFADYVFTSVAAVSEVLLIDVDESAGLDIENRHRIETLIEQLAQSRL